MGGEQDEPAATATTGRVRLLSPRRRRARGAVGPGHRGAWRHWPQHPALHRLGCNLRRFRAVAAQAKAMTHEYPLLDRLLARGRRHRPLIGAHRGASARAPENTLAAFRAALEDGAELVELDVHLTRDGRLAVIHDEDTRRTTGAAGVVAEMSMSELRRLDAGRHKGQQ